ncbi:unnamed protein product [Brachionus calyciflorus]|uniref:Calpain catalytic domain-containing protein n=1 Tax=Brachionus calyciflorus TaxID=104777 RepID=A0A813WUW2_9BILA|nr:unnamed protein product [Brachionus calyciflorus]
MDFEKIDIKNKIVRITNVSDRKIIPFKNQDYLSLKKECQRTGRLFEDPLFPTVDKSMFYTQSVPFGTKWKRPNEISNKPAFICNEVNAGDLDQGYLGNCWFIAGCAAIALIPELFDNVVPKGQVMEGSEYTGIFHFHFWNYGQWVDVVVDDRLPVDSKNKLLFCSNKQEPNEFWAALLEKAYAKMSGCYENLDGGNTTDALIDMTGGIQETFDIKEMKREAHKNDMWKVLVNSRKHKSLIGSSIAPNPRIREARLYNGLVMGHAYTVTKIACIEINRREVKLIRVRNPWGNEVEWKGAWSDSSYEWSTISEDVKKALEFKKMPDGEFWMSFDDFYRNFENVQLCNLTPDAFSDEILKGQENSKLTWKLTSYHGEWIPGHSSGGCGKGNEAIFWTNPQFLITLTDVDPDDNENMATIIISLLQKYTREKRVNNRGESCEEFIQFRLYRILKENDANNARTTGKRLYASQLERCATSGSYINLREVTKRFRVAPGNYLIIPSCYDAGIKGEFLIRLYTENPINQNNCSILHDHKDDLKLEDIFFKNPNSLNDAFSSWANLLVDSATKSNDLKTVSVTSTKASNAKSSDIPLSPFHVKEYKLYTDDFDLNDKVEAKKFLEKCRRINGLLN